MAFVINNPGGYNTTATTFAVVSTATIHEGEIYETARGEHVIVTDVGTNIGVARVGVNDTTVDIVDDNEELTLVTPDITETDDMTSGANWTVWNDDGGTVVFGAGGADCTLAFLKVLGLWFDTPVAAGWTTIRATVNFEKDDLIGLTFGTAENNPNQGHAYYNSAGQDTSGYTVKKSGTNTQAIDRSGPTFLGTTSSLIDLDAVTTLVYVITKMGNGKVRFFGFKEDTKADTSATGILDDPDEHPGEVIVGFSFTSPVTGNGVPVLKDFVLEVFGGGNGGNGAVPQQRNGQGASLGFRLGL